MPSVAAVKGAETRFSALGEVVREAVAFALQFPKELQPQVFELALEEVRGKVKSHDMRTIANTPPVSVPVVTDGLALVAEEIGVDLDTLQRTVVIGEDGRISFRARMDARTGAELQVKYAVVYCYLKEKALSVRTTPISELRDLCQAEGCYNLANFTRNFRGSDLLRENGQKGAHDRSYVVSVKGIEYAKVLLKELVEQ